MVKDMTKGTPTRLLLSFAAPLLLGNLFQQLYSMVDALALGRGVGVGALAAAGATGSVQFLVFGFVQGMTHGYSVLVAQQFGARDLPGVRRAVANAVWLALVSSLAITAASLAGSRGMMTLMQTPADIFDDALLYIRILFIGMSATVLYNVFASVLRALGNSVSPLIILVISSLINVGLDIWFVMGLHWGVAGAAWATVIAQALSGIMCLLVMTRMPQLHFEKGEAAPSGKTLAALLRLGLPVGLMNSITAVGTIILQVVVNGFGSAAVAAYTTGARIIGLAEQPSSIIGLSLSTYVGQNIGAGRLDRVRAGVRQGAGIGFGINIILGVLLIFFARPLVGAFVSAAQQEVIELARSYLIAAGVTLWTLGLLFACRFSLQSLGDTTIPMLSGALELVLRVGVVLVLARVFQMGFLSVCIAGVSAWVGAALMLGIAYCIRMAKMENGRIPMPGKG